jgi:hypothetical protein
VVTIVTTSRVTTSITGTEAIPGAPAFTTIVAGHVAGATLAGFAQTKPVVIFTSCDGSSDSHPEPLE